VPEAAHTRLSRPLRALLIAVAIVAAQATPVNAAERHADRSTAEAARVSLAEAADRMVEGTREIGLFALSLVGIDYRYGGETPDRGLDCSGLIRYVFQQVTGVMLPRTAKELSRIGKDIRTTELEPGDLVFFNTRRFAFSHVGIYLGNDRFIHAPSRGGEVGVASLASAYWHKRYNGARRLVGVLPALMPSLIAHAEASTPADAAEPPDAEANASGGPIEDQQP
jgi:cell wall-associated NlpC family hydrolase